MADAVTLGEVTLNAVPPATRVQHRYSPRCDASWARAQSTIKVRSGTLSIQNDEYLIQGAGGAGEWWWTTMLDGKRTGRACLRVPKPPEAGCTRRFE